MNIAPHASPASIFNTSKNKTSDVLHERRALIAEIGKAKPNFTQEYFLTHIDKVLEHRLELVEITQDSEHQDMIPQLVGKDDAQKHGTDSLDDLLKYRVGKKSENKTVFAIIDRSARQIIAAVYVFRAGMDDKNDNVGTILETPCAPLKAAVNTLVCYSINNFKVDGTNTPLLKGSGEKLITKVLNYVAENLPPHIKVMTASPFRNKTMAEHPDFHGLSDEEQRAFVFKTALTMTDGVMKFHCGNGAKIGRVNLHANMPGSLDYANGAVMINYHYTTHPILLKAAKRSFRECAAAINPEERRDIFEKRLLTPEARQQYLDSTTRNILRAPSPALAVLAAK